MAGVFCLCVGVLFLPAASAQKETPSLQKERARLSQLKTAELKKLTAILNDPAKSRDARVAALFGIGALGTFEALKVLEGIYDHPIDKTNGLRERLEIIRMVHELGAEEGVPLLLHASKDAGLGGDERKHAARALADILGPRALPRLREMREDSSDLVRLVVRAVMARLGDKQAKEDILAEVDTAQFFQDVMAAQLIEAITLLHKSLKKWSADDKFLYFTLGAAGAALHLGDRDAVPVMIEQIGKDVGHLGVNTPRQMLATYTRMDFGDDKARWRAWWEREGKNEPLFSSHLAAEHKQAIARAVLAWARSDKSGPFLPTKVIYVAKDRALKTLESETVRFYSQAELKLLDVPLGDKSACSLQQFTSNGNRAFVVLCRPARPVGTSAFTVELRRENEEWQVVGAKQGAVWE